jgi:hypothetical protein
VEATPTAKAAHVRHPISPRSGRAQHNGISAPETTATTAYHPAWSPKEQTQIHPGSVREHEAETLSIFGLASSAAPRGFQHSKPPAPEPVSAVL